MFHTTLLHTGGISHNMDTRHIQTVEDVEQLSLLYPHTPRKDIPMNKPSWRGPRVKINWPRIGLTTEIYEDHEGNKYLSDFKMKTKDLTWLTDEELAIRYPNVREPFRRTIENGRRKIEDKFKGKYRRKREEKYKKRFLPFMNKKISKHVNTLKFNEYFAQHIGVELIGETLKEVLMSQNEKTENKLKAIAEINKYNFIPSQAQEIKHEIDDSFDTDKRDRLKELLAKAGNN